MLDQPITSKMLAEKDDAVGRIIFNNPARHNAVSLDMWQAVAQIMDDFEADPGVRVIVVTGAGGKAFVSGADISEFKEKRANEEAAAAYSKVSEAARLKLHETLKPTIAMIRGYCIGGGLATAIGCDIRIAAEGSRFGIPAAKQIVREALKDEGRRDMALCQRVVDECFASADYAEGRTAFMEKRRPVFTGR